MNPSENRQDFQQFEHVMLVKLLSGTIVVQDERKKIKNKA